MGDDPDENMTAVENLGSLLLKGGLPSINSLVDSCNLASLQTLMPIGIFDADKTIGELMLDVSDAGEEYEPIGIDKEVLAEGLLVLRDNEGVISRPMYKDSKKTMITEETKTVYIITVQYFPISDDEPKRALEIAVDLVTTSSQGGAGDILRFEEDAI